MPSESLVVTAGVFAATGEPNLAGVIVVAALGAFVGDHISYFFGRTAGGRVLERAKPGSRKAAAFKRGGKLLADRGGTILIVCRYIPGARTAITLTAGAVALPAALVLVLRRDRRVSWGAYSALDRLHRRRRVRGGRRSRASRLGLGIALTVAVVVELIRHRRGRRLAGA